MRVTISELTRQNRELELKLSFAERQKKRFVGLIKSLFDHYVRTEPADKANASIKEEDMKGQMITTAAGKKINLEEAIWPGTSLYRGPSDMDKIGGYVPITGNSRTEPARGKPVQFLNFRWFQTGVRPVSDQCQTSVMPDCQTGHSARLRSW